MLNLIKKLQESFISIGSHSRGYDNDPTDYDYNSQRFHWMHEWSKYYCKLRTKEIEKLLISCKDCTSGSCETFDDAKNCEKCKEACKSFSNFVTHWKHQLNIHSKFYKELYQRPNGTGNAAVVTSRSKRNVRIVEDNNTIEIFLKKVKIECSDPESGEKYLDKSSNYKEIKLIKSNNNNYYYAFTYPANEYIRQI
ncbi:erythrocyte membrane protein 1, PfEMP1, putative [Plasmodium sp.]|nr:erythrocyte membrane protein 1, PfEMP1, putative [Plasmodium sp.]